jgi:hypothetical protein
VHHWVCCSLGHVCPVLMCIPCTQINVYYKIAEACDPVCPNSPEFPVTAQNTNPVHCGCPFDHFQTLCTIFWHDAPILCNHHTTLTICGKFWREKHVLHTKTERHYDHLHATMFPMLLPLYFNLKTQSPYFLAHWLLQHLLHVSPTLTSNKCYHLQKNKMLA